MDEIKKNKKEEDVAFVLNDNWFVDYLREALDEDMFSKLQENAKGRKDPLSILLNNDANG